MLMGLLNLFAAAAGLLVLAGSAVVVGRLQNPQRKTYAFALAHGLPTDPADLGLVSTERTFRFADGSKTVGWVIEGAKASGPVVIISHGWNSCRYGSLVRVPLLMRFASRLVVYDLRGHGESTAPTSRLGTTEADDLLQLVDQLDDLQTPVVLFGSSMGAGTAIAAAAKGSARIAAVIAEGPYRYFREPIAGRLRCSQLPTFPLSHLATAFMAVRLGGLRRFDRAALAAGIPCPLLVLHGSADPVCRLDSARQIADAAPAGQLVVFPGAGHGNLAMFNESAYIDAMTTFMATLDGDQTSGAPVRQPTAVALTESDTRR